MQRFIPGSGMSQRNQQLYALARHFAGPEQRPRWFDRNPESLAPSFRLIGWSVASLISFCALCSFTSISIADDSLQSLAATQSDSQVAGPSLFAEDGCMYVGTAYYPEHWPVERWEADFKLMKEAGFNVVRLGEFAWAKLEPTEGEFDFEWLLKAIDEADKHGLRVILGTPTAVMPAWLAHSYPDALSMKPDGTRTVWGGRRHNCFTSDAFLKRSDRIVTEMAKRCADHPAVVGWQIDNELGGTDCRCASCRREYQQWLAKKYGDIDSFNKAWGNHFWSLQVSQWEHIPIPDDRTDSWSISNPSASLDWQRFTSDLNVDFLNRQLKVLKDICPKEHFYTHNLMGLYSNLDYYNIAENIDVVCWDNYPHLSPSYPVRSSMAADLMRGLKGKNFWIMEQTAGPLGWGEFSTTPLPGELRKICYQQLAHGSDAQIWFRWRTCTAGREQYWHGLLGHDGKVGRRYREAALYASECKRLQPYLAGTTVRSKVGIIYDYDSLWALQIQEGYPGASLTEAVSRYYNAFSRLGFSVDLIPPAGEFSSYALLVAPHLHIMPDSLADALDRYVDQGGVLLTDCRTGVKDETNLAHARTLPGRLSNALGIEINEYESGAVGMKAKSTREYPVVSEELGEQYTAIRYFDWVAPTTAKSFAEYGGATHLKDYSAVTHNDYGAGAAWYVGTIFKEQQFYDDLLKRITDEAGVVAPLPPPRGVEVVQRVGSNSRVLFLINHTDSTKQISSIPENLGDLLTGEEVHDTLSLDGFG